MDYRPYILAGTFLLLIVAIVTFVAAFVRSRRDQSTRHERRIPDIEYAAATGGGEVDTDLQGLELTVDAGAPSASLLTPLRTGEWMPPDSPARAEDLPDVSLAGRVADFVPAPAVPEPPFSIEAYQPWEVAPTAEVGDAHPVGHEPVPAISAPVPLADRMAAPDAGSAAEPQARPDTFDDEIRALLPTTEFTAVDLTTPPDRIEATHAESTEAAVPAPHEGRQPESLEDHLAALTAEEPIVEPVPAPIVEPVPAQAPFESVPPAYAPPELGLDSLADTRPAELPAERPVGGPAPEPVVAPASVPAAAGSDLDEAREWVDMLRETQGAPTVARPHATAPPPVARPTVTVATAEPPTLAVEAAVEAAPSTRRARPAVRVHGVEELADPARHAPSQRLAPPPIAARSRDAAEDIVMAAPVEMWFGDARVGVKAGTATYERFMKYATVLLDDLKALKQAAR